MDTYLNVLILVILILLSGFFSASETALTAYRSNNLEKLDVEKKRRIYELLKQWLKEPNAMLTGLLIGNNIVNILASSIATVVIVNYFGQKSSSVLLATAIMTVLILIFGEITPKLIARNNSSSIAEFVITIVYIIAFIFKPIIAFLMVISKLIGRILGINMTSSQMMITEEDIISFVNVGNAEGIIEEDEKEMIHSIVTLGETTAKEVMTPRTSMLAFEGSKTINEVWDEIIENGFSRIPVYNETIDDIIGVVYVKDLMEHIKNGDLNLPISQFVRNAYYVPETKSIIEILKEFRKLQVHIAMVLDEYGGIVGLVTIEDLIEEIVGDIRDEYDDEEEFFFVKIAENEYEVDAMIDIETLDKELNINLPISEDYESLGGLIVTELGRICDVNDEITIDNIYLRVLEVDKMRVSKVLIKVLEEEQEGE
ncbi:MULTISPECIES: hemolysin family protein [Fusobacterium]|uniref:hemolysin family protein n=1 Tax=Fusobacterium TaxID=848 RepID=UPI0025BD3C80|nr:hemolysin family protein [Fusobacterium sp.]MDD7392419.1 hemolysin family protein [Fusobacteriaceae bacterium]MDY5304966.1 hemolysin family protein [Fusobacterium gastrosuis]MCI5725047.1 hemolysin family protein [Fusobacterium sp.]MDD7409885.1 hemolysin family protein [Fusobacteriaceae bacterium]MDY5712466.1 hemolysin family protein [Fusobacterium gastrosuis]